MTQPVGPFSQTRWPEDPAEIPPSPPPANRRPSDPPEPPELPDFDAEAYATASRAMGSAGMLRSPVFEAIGAMHHARDLKIQQGLDAFRAQATPTYHTPDGDVRVATPFWMAGRYPVTGQPKVDVNRACDRAGINGQDRWLVQHGRGTPQQVRRATQSLIDLGLLPAGGGSVEDRVRTMMMDHGIGMDCAAYVGQGFASSRGVDRAHSQLGSVPIGNDDLSNLRYRGFVQVGIEAARPGDIVALGPPPAQKSDPPPPGHNTIVYAARDATDADRQSLRLCAAGAEPQDRSALREIAARGSLRVVVVDSAWGSNHKPLVGGVERRMWWHDPLAGTWVSTNALGTAHIGKTPYDHPVAGVYRPRNEP